MRNIYCSRSTLKNIKVVEETKKATSKGHPNHNTTAVIK
jgi:hypothetical protein